MGSKKRPVFLSEKTDLKQKEEKKVIYVTGDTHNDINIQKLYDLAMRNPDLTKSDMVIIAGDFGAVWSEKTLKENLDRYSALPFTVLFVDGNHENFDLLSSFPVTCWHGGKVQMIRPDIIHLMRGQIYEIEGKTFFTFGGGTSIDKYRRAEHESWWKQEIPTYEELDEGMANLKKYDYRVDYVITHSCDEKALWYPPLRQGGITMPSYTDNQILSCFEDVVKYKHWFFGHYHLDGDLTDRKTAVFEKIYLLEDENECDS